MYLKNTFQILYPGLLKSYSQIFFSENKIFAAVLILASFIDVWAGIAGVICIVIVFAIAAILGFSKEKISKGLYGFNALLVGLGLGIYYEPAVEFYVVLIIAAILTFFLNIAIEGVLTKYALPFLSVPFLLAMWTIVLATRSFEALDISARGVYTLNDMYVLGGNKFINLYNWWNEQDFVMPLKIYFISLGAIFFQFNVLSGILIAIGLLYVSRIGFSLSLIGFFAAYFFYYLIGADINNATYTNIGFNYILTSIAIGGYFLIPSVKSYIWTVILVPLVAVLTICTNNLLSVYQLPVYSLSFNILVLLFLYVLKLRLDFRKGPSLVVVHESSPEKNLYAYQNYRLRFGAYKSVSFTLPFWGEWTVAQGHDGEITHQGKWKHAWDFVIQNSDKKTFKEKGTIPENFYCYGKSVIAPHDGIVEQVVDSIDDNDIGEVNLKQNWGNTIIIKHFDGLFSKMSHLKPRSIKVSKGDTVKRGQVVAQVGNSGRSPEPHLHFQLQTTPFIGSETLDYPLGYYIKINGQDYEFEEFKSPKTGDVVANININPMLKKAFKLIPGQYKKWRIDSQEIEWKIVVDSINNTYIQCQQTKARAYFQTNDQVHYFTGYKGNKNNLLYHFYLAAYKIQFGFYDGIELQDKIPVHLMLPSYRLVLQDFIAPFYIYLKGCFKIKYISSSSQFDVEEILLKSQAYIKLFNKIKRPFNYKFVINNKGIEKFTVETGKKKIEAVCTED